MDENYCQQCRNSAASGDVCISVSLIELSRKERRQKVFHLIPQNIKKKSNFTLQSSLLSNCCLFNIISILALTLGFRGISAKSRVVVGFLGQTVSPSAPEQ